MRDYLQCGCVCVVPCFFLGAECDRGCGIQSGQDLQAAQQIRYSLPYVAMGPLV